MLDTETRTITVLSSRLGEVRGQLEKLKKKARKYGNPDIDFSVGPVQMEDRYDDRGRKIKVSVNTITISSGKVQIGDHEFVARVDLKTAKLPLIDCVPGKSVPEQFRTTDGHCDHCNKIRNRNDVFVIRDKTTGEYSQIGRACLKDYMGIDPAEATAKFAWFKATADLDSEYGSSCGFSWAETIHGILTATSAAIRLYGWLPKSHPDILNGEAQSTADRVAVLWIFRPSAEQREEIRKLKEAINDDDRAVADATIAFVQNEMTGDSEYVWNLKALLAEDVLYDRKRVGLVVSAVSAYQRHLGTLARIAAQREVAAASEHVGAVGERLRKLSLKVLGGKAISTAWGDSILYKFIDDRGNLFAWFASNSLELEVGKTYSLDASIKAHNEFKGVKETTLTRAKLAA